MPIGIVIEVFLEYWGLLPAGHLISQLSAGRFYTEVILNQYKLRSLAGHLLWEMVTDVLTQKYGLNISYLCSTYTVSKS